MPLIKRRPGALLAIGVLITISILLMLLRAAWPRQGGVPTGDTVWELTFEFRFRSERGGTTVNLAKPADTRHARLFSQSFYHPRLRQDRSKEKKTEPRETVFAAAQPGVMMLRAVFQIHCSPRTVLIKEGTISLLPETRQLYLESEPQIPADHPAIQSVVQQAFADITDNDKLLETIADFCEKKITVSPVDGETDALGALHQGKATAIGRARAMTALCRAVKIPARIVSGFVLTHAPDAHPHFWMEAFLNKKWIPFDLENGFRRELPAQYLPVRRGGNAIIQLYGGSDLVQSYSVASIAAPRGILGSDRRRFIETMDLTRLPVSTQDSLIILLLLPLGALLTTLFRNLIGIRTIGTFTPTLLALATVYADRRIAAIIFLIVVVIGIGGRALLPGLKLMKVPRLSVVFTLVALTMAFSISVLDFVSAQPAGHLVLLPMVVLTTIVDRVYSVADENSKRVALLRLFWTIVVALCCVLIFQWGRVGRLLLFYPEIHLITLAVLLLLGLYDGRKLTDISYFRFLVEKTKAKVK